MRNSLRTQLTWTFIGLAVIPLLLVGVLLSLRSYQVQQQQALALESQVAQRIATAVDAYFKELENSMRTTVAVTELHSLTRDKQERHLNFLLSNQDAFDELILLDRDGYELLVASRSRVVGPAGLRNRTQTNEYLIPQETGEIYVSPVRMDEMTSKPLITLSVPLIDPLTDKVKGVLIAEARIKRVWDFIAAFQLSEGEDIYIVDEQNSVIAHRTPLIALRGTYFDPPQTDGIYRGLNGNNAVIATNQIRFGGQVFTIVAEKNTAQALNLASSTMIITGTLMVLALGMAAGIGFFAVRRIVQPIEGLVTSAQSIASGDLSKTVEVTGRNEIGRLAEAFNTMRAGIRQSQEQLQNYMRTLEQRVADRTKDLERRSLQLQAAAEVGNAVASIRDLDQLLSQVTSLISNRFGFYHVGIFLLDPSETNAVLQATNSEGGQRMLKRGHQLRVGQEGIVGYVTAAQQPRIALDVGQDAVFFNNPDLPDTRSEMALPLLAGGKLLGALDVQSTSEAAFSREDIAILQILADQVAVAIENSRLFSETQATLERMSRAYGEVSGKAWEQLLRGQPDLGYLCNIQDTISPVTGEWEPELVEASQLGKLVQSDDATLAIPIKIRDRVTGAIRLSKTDPATSWSDDEVALIETLTDQLSVALESARLYQETQRRAERERMAGLISAKVRATNDPQTILQTAVQELRRALQVKQAQVLVHPNPDLYPLDSEDNGDQLGG